MKIRGFEKISKGQFMSDFISVFNWCENNAEFVYNELIKLPKRGTAKSAGYDVFAPIGFELKPHEEIKLPTGIRAYMLQDEYLKAHPRSGQGFKYYVRLANTTGIIDSDYIESDNEGHIWVKLRNEGHKNYEVQAGDGICQMIFSKYLLADGDDYTGEKRNGGFGSTDKKEGGIVC